MVNQLYTNGKLYPNGRILGQLYTSTIVYQYQWSQSLWSVMVVFCKWQILVDSLYSSSCLLAILVPLFDPYTVWLTANLVDLQGTEVVRQQLYAYLYEIAETDRAE